MQSHHADPGIYIRSMATRGSLGGLASTTADVATVLDASGRDIVMIETVGVGQDEVDIVRLADVTIVILVPGMGDDVQTIKAGIMEIADIFVINKSDREGAERVEREIRAMQSLAMRQRQLGSADREDGGQRGNRHCRTAADDREISRVSSAGRPWRATAESRTGAQRIDGDVARRAFPARALDITSTMAKPRSMRRRLPSTSATRILWWKKIVDELGKPE